jgi:hypothetical protein
MAAATPSYLPIPSDATRVGDWEPDADKSYIRVFDGTHRESDGMCVDVIGVQNIDGSVRRRWVEVGQIGDSREEPVMLEAHEARNFADMVRHDAFREHAQAAEELAATLLAAAEEIERLSRTGGMNGMGDALGELRQHARELASEADGFDR